MRGILTAEGGKASRFDLQRLELAHEAAIEIEVAGDATVPAPGPLEVGDCAAAGCRSGLVAGTVRGGATVQVGLGS